MYEHDALIYHAFTGRGGTKKNHKYVRRLGSPGNYVYIYPEDIENAKNKIKSGAKSFNEWNKSGKTSKYDKDLARIKKSENKVTAERTAAYKKEANAKAEKYKGYAKEADKRTKAKAPSTVTPSQKAAADRINKYDRSKDISKDQKVVSDAIKNAKKYKEYAKIADSKTKITPKKAKAPSTTMPGQKAAIDRINNSTIGAKKKKKKKKTLVNPPAGYGTNYTDAYNKAYR